MRTQGGVQHHPAGVCCGYLANGDCFPPQRMLAHGVQHRGFGLRRDDGDELALIGNIQRIQAKQFACCTHALRYRHTGLFDFDPNAALRSKFVQSSGQTPARWVAQTMDAPIYSEHRRHKTIQWCTIALQGE